MIDLRLGDCLDVLRELPDNSVDAVITDPPYGLSFMGKEWDYGIPGQVYWEATLCVAKPGAMLLAFGGTRTHHRLMCAIEDAGWEIRDCLMWLYGQGFPKSHNLDGEFKGWGTALKPAWEPIILAMKPLDKNFAQNALAWGVAGLNIAGTRIGTTPLTQHGRSDSGNRAMAGRNYAEPAGRAWTGRWPANLLLDEDAAQMLDAQSGERRSSGIFDAVDHAPNGNGWATNFGGKGTPATMYADTGGASRFFYVAKASRAERERGLDGMPETLAMRYGEKAQGPLAQQTPSMPTPQRNHHPTVKPLRLMEYLCTLTATPTGGVVLDPFMGSGTTGVACVKTGRGFIGIEIDEGYFNIAQKRISEAQMQETLVAL